MLARCLGTIVLALCLVETAASGNEHKTDVKQDKVGNNAQQSTKLARNDEIIFDQDDVKGAQTQESSENAVTSEPASNRQVRSAAGGGGGEDEPTVFMYNNQRQLKRLLHHLRGDSKQGRDNQLAYLRAVSKLQKRETTATDAAGKSTPGAGVGTPRRVRRQPLDRLDEPSAWRIKLQPKFGRDTAAQLGNVDGEWLTADDRLAKRQPLDRLDEPSEWRIKLNPKFLHNRRADKRQPLDRVDEPSDWRIKLTPKLNRYGKDLEQDDDLDVVEKRQPLDRLDEPSDWRAKLVPKFNRYRNVQRRTQHKFM